MTPGLAAEEGIASLLTHRPPGMRVVPRERTSPWRGRRRWAALRADDVLRVLDELPQPGVVLARPASADPGAACLAAIAGLLGHHVVVLPDAADESAWVAGVAAELDAGDDESFVRAVQVLCCGPAIAASFPRRRWGPTGIPVPALRPATLARWACCSWRPCCSCDGGGLPGLPCRCCGAPVPAAIDEGQR
jgi:hypothetical protein